MGAGCYYTYKFNGEKAAWVNIDEENGFGFFTTFAIIENVLQSIGYAKYDDNEFRNGLYKIQLKETYYSDGILLYIEPKMSQHDNNGWGSGYNCKYNLAIANHHRSENKIWKALQKAGLKLHIAVNGYQSRELVLD